MRLVDYFTSEGHRVAIVDDESGAGRYLRVVFFDPTLLSVNRVAANESRFMRDIERRPHNRHTPLVSTARRWLRGVSSKTDGARELLTKAARA